MFIVTVKDWAKARGQDGITAFNNNSHVESDYTNKAGNYEIDYPDPGLAGFAALESMYPDMFNYYVKKAGSNTLTPYKVVNGVHPTVTQVNC
ncbi:hypothetical protein [Mucilaginibacter panaciglaebae]|uniref:Uncharacterized protein n=1 Tax=Mucilaginibacter panaciglaebae TaxID=502331 RepID=A0ABP7X5L0_9SPHI